MTGSEGKFGMFDSRVCFQLLSRSAECHKQKQGD